MAIFDKPPTLPKGALAPRAHVHRRVSRTGLGERAAIGMGHVALVVALAGTLAAAGFPAEPGDTSVHREEPSLVAPLPNQPPVADGGTVGSAAKPDSERGALTDVGQYFLVAVLGLLVGGVLRIALRTRRSKPPPY